VERVKGVVVVGSWRERKMQSLGSRLLSMGFGENHAPPAQSAAALYKALYST
jgi:hypothetical protein